jgi:CRISPR-associated protein Cas1
MSTIYITTQGATLQKRSGQFVVQKHGQILQNIPETHVRQLVLCGNINVTTPVMAYCLEKQVDVVFLSHGGRFRGRLNGDAGRSAELRRKQYELALDPTFCLYQARSVVGGKIQNQIAIARRQSGAAEATTEMATLKKSLAQANTAPSGESLLGVEGAASAAYFRLFAGWVPAPWTFAGRTAHPPRDGVNALLSLSYTLIYNRLASHLNLIGLDPYLGFFHAPRQGHAALASDLMEEFRPLIADALVLKLLRRKQIQPAGIPKEKGEFRLSKEASQVFFREFEEKLTSQRKVQARDDWQLSYASIIKRQAHHLARVIAGEEQIYQPFTVK